MNIQVPPDNIAVLRIIPLSASEAPKPATGTVSVDNYAYAYVAYNPGGQLVLVTKQIPPMGTKVPVTLTLNGLNSQGVALTQFTQVFDLNGPADPDPATHFAITEGPTVRDKVGYPVPPDAGQSIPLQ